MSNSAEIRTGDSWTGGKYADLYVNGEKYTGFGSTESTAIKAAEVKANTDQSKKN